ncbi:hypothetical protein ACOMHN_061279 [Nucella lapillus]
MNLVRVTEVYATDYDTCLSTLQECLSIHQPGHYPVCDDCSRFLKCDATTSSAAVIQCPTSLFYDVTLGNDKSYHESDKFYLQNDKSHLQDDKSYTQNDKSYTQNDKSHY